MRKLAYLVEVGKITPILNADAIEMARVGGWSVVVQKNQFLEGEVALYIEIDAFLPSGNPAWQFLVDQRTTVFHHQQGHALRTVERRKKISQGLLLKLSAVPGAEVFPLGASLAKFLNISKYEEPLPKELEGIARGMYPTSIPKTDQERIQNCSEELAVWQSEERQWEVTEKLEGASTTYAFLSDDFHACSRQVDYLDLPDNTMWCLAHQRGWVERFQKVLKGRNIAVQGELVGPGIEKNVYRLKNHEFYAYDVYDVDAACQFGSEERLELVRELGLKHAPVVHARWTLDEHQTMDTILEMAIGPSALRKEMQREGLVYKSLDGETSFKGISNLYLKKQSKG